MLQSSILDTLIGLMLMYASLALVATGITEIISTWLRIRPKVLEKAVEQLLGSSIFAELCSHARIATLTRDMNDQSPGMRLPAYLAPGTFAATLADVLLQKVSADGFSVRQEVAADFSKLRTALEGIKEPHLKYLLLAAAAKAEAAANLGGDYVASFEKELEAIYNGLMDRVSGWFKRNAHTLSLIVAAVVCTFTNADTLQMARTLSYSPELRVALVTQARTAQSSASQIAGSDCAALLDFKPAQLEGKTKEELQTILNCQMSATGSRIAQAGTAFPIGWENKELPPATDTLAWAMKVLGILISSLAVSLGAGFWFQALQNLMRLTNKTPPASAPTVTTTTAAATATTTAADGK